MSWLPLGAAFVLDQIRLRLLGTLVPEAKVPSGPRKGQEISAATRHIIAVPVSLCFIGELLLVLKAVGLW